jgi:hypothetical protein
MRNFSLACHVLDAGTDPHKSTYHFLGQLSADIADHALKFISAMKFSPSEGVPLSTM